MSATVLRHIDPAYRHYPKRVTPQVLFVPGTSQLKWYDIARPDAPVPPHVGDLARGFLGSEAKAGRLEADGELGFVLLHLCGGAFYFLIVCTWRGSNELWETVYFKKDDATPDFSLFPRDRPHKGTYCVWELGPVLHEKTAWVRFLTSARDRAAVDAYLADRFAGEV